MSLQVTKRANVLVILSAAAIGLGIIVSFSYYIVFFYAGISIIAYYYIARYILQLRVRTLNKLEITREHPRIISEDKDLSVILKILNRSALSVRVEVTDHYPQFFRLKDGTNALMLTVPAKGYAENHFVLKPTSIGEHSFGNIELTMRDPLCLFVLTHVINLKDEVHVVPSEKEITKGALLSSSFSSYGGGTSSRIKGQGFEFADIREYVYGDSYRSIEWSATARKNRLMVRENYAENPLNLMIILDSGETMAYGESGKTKLDYACRAVASLSAYLQRRGDFIGIALIKNKPEVIPLGRGTEQTARILNKLSTVKPERSKTSLGQAIRYALSLGSIKGKTLFLVISDLNTESDLVPLKMLTAMNHEVAVISPYTPLFELHDIKGVEREVYFINLAYQRKIRNKLIKQALRLGIPVVDVGPDDILNKIIFKVETLRVRGGSW